MNAKFPDTKTMREVLTLAAERRRCTTRSRGVGVWATIVCTCTRPDFASPATPTPTGGI